MNFWLSVTVVLPLCIYIFIGVFSRKFNLIDDATAAKMNGFAYKVLFPINMFQNVMNAGDAMRSGELSLAVFLLGYVFVVFLLLLIFVPMFIHSKPRQGSFIQGCFRANSILFAIPVVTAICGEENVGVAAVCVTLLVPFYNVLSVVLLEMKRGGNINVLSILKGIVTNPIILGAVAGVVYVLSGVNFPAVITSTIKTLANMVTPLALMLLGCTLRFDGIVDDAKALIGVCTIKLIVLPAVAMCVAWLFGYRDVALITVFGITCVPTAVSTYTMAQQMGADGKLAGEIVAVTTMASMVTVFLWVLVLTAIHVIV